MFHSTQSAFLSSIDQHTQFGYQQLLPEAVAVVCSPKFGYSKWLRLTPSAMKVVGGCSMGGFHEHATRARLYEPALNIQFCKNKIKILDFREEGAPFTISARQTPTPSPAFAPAQHYSKRKEPRTKTLTGKQYIQRLQRRVMNTGTLLERRELAVSSDCRHLS